MFFCFIPMKISHKLCVRMDGTQFLILWWFTAKNECGNDIIAWVYVHLIFGILACYPASHKKWNRARNIQNSWCWHIFLTWKWNAHLFNICEPVPPSRFMQVICDLMFVNLGIVELRSVPTANTIICAEITLDFKMIDGWPIPLKERKKEV